MLVQEFPYQFDGNKEEIVQKNLIRVAETWMGGMRKYFYASTRVYPFKRAELTDQNELASLEERKQLRQRLQCKNFEWYMYNIIPEVPVPPMNAVLYGEIKNSKSDVRSLTLLSLVPVAVLMRCLTDFPSFEKKYFVFVRHTTTTMNLTDHPQSGMVDNFGRFLAVCPSVRR